MNLTMPRERLGEVELNGVVSIMDNIDHCNECWQKNNSGKRDTHACSD